MNSQTAFTYGQLFCRMNLSIARRNHQMVLSVRLRSPAILADLQDRFGGNVTKDRWQVSDQKRLLKLLRKMRSMDGEVPFNYRDDREAELESAIHFLELRTAWKPRRRSDPPAALLEAERKFRDV